MKKINKKELYKIIGLSIIDIGAITYGCLMDSSLPKFLFGFMCLFLGNIIGYFLIDFKGNN